MEERNRENIESKNKFFFNVYFLEMCFISIEYIESAKRIKHFLRKSHCNPFLYYANRSELITLKIVETIKCMKYDFQLRFYD